MKVIHRHRYLDWHDAHMPKGPQPLNTNWMVGMESERVGMKSAYLGYIRKDGDYDSTHVGVQKEAWRASGEGWMVEFRIANSGKGSVL